MFLARILIIIFASPFIVIGVILKTIIDLIREGNHA